MTLALAGLSVMAGCGNIGQIREAVGIAVPPPDEFMVVSNAPLTLPSDLSALPPPRLGAPSRVAPDAQAAARSALAGSATVTPAAAPSAAEQALAQRAGPADPAIRETLQAEAETDTGPSRYGLESLFGYKFTDRARDQAERLEPREEAERLRSGGVTTPVPPPPEG